MSGLKKFFAKDGTKSVVSSLISILIGLVFGAIVVFIVGMSKKTIGVKGAWEGVRLIFFGVLNTGRSATGALTWGFNASNLGNMLFRATPVILTGLSVAVAFKTGLFNIGAPGQYLMGTLTSLAIAAIAGVVLNAIIPGRDYEYGNPEPYRFDKEGI